MLSKEYLMARGAGHALSSFYAEEASFGHDEIREDVRNSVLPEGRRHLYGWSCSLSFHLPTSLGAVSRMQTVGQIPWSVSNTDKHCILVLIYHAIPEEMQAHAPRSEL